MPNCIKQKYENSETGSIRIYGPTPKCTRKPDYPTANSEVLSTLRFCFVEMQCKMRLPLLNYVKLCY
jgi:hypothetical protein